MQTEEGWEGSRGGVGVAETEVRSNYPELQALYGRKKTKKTRRAVETRALFFFLYAYYHHTHACYEGYNYLTWILKSLDSLGLGQRNVKIIFYLRAQ